MLIDFLLHLLEELDLLFFVREDEFEIKSFFDETILVKYLLEILGNVERL